MFTQSERLLIFRFLFSKKSDGYVSIFTWFSIIGISLGVAAIIIVMSFLMIINLIGDLKKHQM